MSRLPGLALSISATTRKRRNGETAGRDYHFLRAREFRKHIAEDRFLEWATYTGHLYGTPRQAVEDHLAGGRDVILEIELQGAEKVLAERPDALMIYIVPPSLVELERRLRGRKTETEEAIQKRLARAKEEMVEVEKKMERSRPGHYVIVNDSLEKATDELVAIIERTREEDEQADRR